MSGGVYVDGHLGGYIEGGDPATFYPELWRWVVNTLHVKTVVDVGCGEGQAIDFFRELGCIVLGIDGVAQEHEFIHRHDFTEGPLTVQPVSADLMWSCEFVEHVAEEHVPNFLATFAVADMVMMTHAEPGQPGYHHVNCQRADYWIDRLADVGLVYDIDLTLASRAIAGRNTSVWNHYVRSGLAFRRDRRLRSASA